MAQLGTYTVPREQKDEDKYLRFFTKSQLLFLSAQLFIDYGIIKLAMYLNIAFIGFFIAFMLTMALVLLVMLRMPSSKFLLGSGQFFIVLLGRMVIHRKKHRKLYIRNYNHNKKEEEKRSWNFLTPHSTT